MQVASGARRRHEAGHAEERRGVRMGGAKPRIKGSLRSIGFHAAGHVM